MAHITFKTLKFRNFLSFGPNLTEIDLNNNNLTAILGINHDTLNSASRNGVGKAQPLYSKILTPNGWTTMGEIQKGDIVTTPNGGTATVIDTFDQGLRDTYRFHFEDGRTVDCDINHLWKTNYGVIPTDEILKHEDVHIPLYKGNKAYFPKTVTDTSMQHIAWRRGYISKINNNTLDSIESDTIKLIKTEYVGKTETKCILISSQDHLYVTDNYIVTHNTAITDALTYALFGKTSRGISNNKLLNKKAKKGQSLQVDLEFSIDDMNYLIKRSEAPSKLQLFATDTDDILKRENNTYVYDISRNKNETNSYIQEILGFDLTLMEYIIANTSETTPFMKLPEDKKRTLIEKLIGIEVIGERAEELKQERKGYKKDLISIESSNNATRAANERIDTQIKSIKLQESQWVKSNQDQIQKLKDKLKQYSDVDFDNQIELLNQVDSLLDKINDIEKVISDRNADIKSLEREFTTLAREHKTISNQISKNDSNIEKLEENICFTCNRAWDDSKDSSDKLKFENDSLTNDLVANEKKQEEIETRIVELQDQIADTSKSMNTLENELMALDEQLSFETMNDLKDAMSFVTNSSEKIEELTESNNPYTETLDGLSNETKGDVDDEGEEELNLIVEHYDYIISLLQSKDSFLRKALIDIWTPQFNSAINKHLGELEFPHYVKMDNELDIKIIDHLDEVYEWGSMSKGQKQRVNIAMTLALTEIYEKTNNTINVKFLDEIIDSGICEQGASQTLNLLSSMNKTIYLITHRQDIMDSVDDILYVEMKNGTSFIGVDDEE